MDAFALDVSERFRAWKGAGISFVLGPAGTDRFAAPVRKAAPTPASPGKHAHAKTQQQPHTRPPKYPRPEPANKAAPSQAALQKHRKAQSTPRQEPAHAPRPEWPTPWDIYRMSLKVPCRTVWTYWDLGYDMGGMPSAARRELLANIISNLQELAGWQKGCVTFWPMAALTAHGKLEADTERFWKGVSITGASHVVVFGRRAFEALFPDREFECATFRHDELSVIALPGPGNVLVNRQGCKRTVWDTLRHLQIR